MQDLNKKIVVTFIIIINCIAPLKLQAQKLQAKDVIDNPNYETGELTKNSFWFIKKGEERYGVIKNHKIILPNVFKNVTKLTGSNLRLDFGTSVSVYNIDKNAHQLPFQFGDIQEVNDKLYCASKAGKYGLVGKNSFLAVKGGKYFEIFFDASNIKVIEY